MKQQANCLDRSAGLRLRPGKPLNYTCSVRYSAGKLIVRQKTVNLSAQVNMRWPTLAFKVPALNANDWNVRQKQREGAVMTNIGLC